MASLTLEEAAEKAGTSKVDIWRAIREGELSARRSDGGGFAIDPDELFRVFETRRPAPAEEPAASTPAEEPAVCAPGLEEPEQGAPAGAEAAYDIEAEFATLGAELKALLGLPSAAPPNEPPGGAAGHGDGEAGQGARLVERNAQLEAELAAVRTIAEKAMAEFATLAQRLDAPADSRRPWWRRIVG
jgi:hypothetical protein